LASLRIPKMRTLGEGNVPAFFKPDFNTELLVRVAGNSAQWIEPLRSALAEVDPTVALDVRPWRRPQLGPCFPCASHPYLWVR